MFKRNAKLLLLFVVFALSLALCPTNGVFALTVNNKYVRTANYYLKAGDDIKKNDFPALAKYDLLILPMEAQVYNKDLFAYLRANNPDIIILAYVPSRSINYLHLDDFAGIRRELLSGIADNWYLRDPAGNKISTWPGTEALNVITAWQTYLPNFVHNKIMSANLWDGIFYDEVDQMISGVNGGNIDLNSDGQKDNASWADGEWQRGMANLFSNSRTLEGADKIIISNGSSFPAYQPYLNGRMFESFPTPWENSGSWSDNMRNYSLLFNQVGYAPVLIVNSNTGNTGQKSNYQKVRFGLASALLGNGYYSFDYGDQGHGQLWYYDEYDAFLGRPAKDPFDLLNANNKNWQLGFWQRDFQNGVALVNSTSQEQTIDFGRDFEKLHGLQDPIQNDGSIITSATLAPKDGIILLRPIEKVINSVFANGSFARIFNKDGQVVRTGFFLYDGQYRGSANIIKKDINNDSFLETVVADQSRVDIFSSSGNKTATFYPYPENYNKGINIAVGDLNNDGRQEIITGTNRGGGPQIRIFNSDGRLISPGFFAYNKNNNGGVSVAICDLNGDGKGDIVTGAGYGNTPQVKIFNASGKMLYPAFLAYASTFKKGINVACGDLSGNGINSIVTGPGFGGSSQVRVFDRNGKVVNNGFYAYGSKSREGVKVIANDIDGDGKAEIIAMTTDVFTITINQ